MTRPAVEVRADAGEAAARAATVIADGLRAAVARRGRATVAFSGGSSPVPMFVALAGLDVPWPQVTVLQVDERVAPPGSPDRNATGLQEHLLDRLAEPPGAVELLPVDEPDHEAAALAASARLARLVPLDVVHLGIGADGHTASWPPGVDPAMLDQAGLVAAVTDFNGFDRLTLTPRALRAAGLVVVLVADAAKAEVVDRWLRGDPALPAAAIPVERLVVVLDEATAPRG